LDAPSSKINDRNKKSGRAKIRGNSSNSIKTNVIRQKTNNKNQSSVKALVTKVDVTSEKEKPESQ